VARDVVLAWEAVAAGLGQHRGDPIERRDGVQRAGSLSRGRALHRPLRPVRIDHALDLDVEPGVAGLAVDHERHEILDEVAGVQIDGVVESLDHFGQEAVREARPPRAVRIAGEEPVEVVVVLGICVDAPLVEAGTVQERKDDERPLHLHWIDQPAEADRGERAGVLGGVDPGGHEHPRSGGAAGERDVGPRIFLEPRVALKGE
jgi:hypothetical protein